MGIEDILGKIFGDPFSKKSIDERYGDEVMRVFREDTGGVAGVIPTFIGSGLVEAWRMKKLRPKFEDLTPETTLDSAEEIFIYHSGDFFDGVLYTWTSQYLFITPMTRMAKEFALEKYGQDSKLYRTADWVDRRAGTLSAGVGVAAVLLGETVGQGGDTPDYLDMPAGFLGVIAVKGAQIFGRYLEHRAASRAMSQDMPRAA